MVDTLTVPQPIPFLNPGCSGRWPVLVLAIDLGMSQFKHPGTREMVMLRFDILDNVFDVT